MATEASIKVYDPLSVLLPVLEELVQLRAQVRRLALHNEHLRLEYQGLHAELVQARTKVEQARRQGKRQGAPFSKGTPRPQPKRPGHKSGAAHDLHGMLRQGFPVASNQEGSCILAHDGSSSPNVDRIPMIDGNEIKEQVSDNNPMQALHPAELPPRPV